MSICRSREESGRWRKEERREGERGRIKRERKRTLWTRVDVSSETQWTSTVKKAFIFFNFFFSSRIFISRFACCTLVLCVYARFICSKTGHQVLRKFVEVQRASNGHNIYRVDISRSTGHEKTFSLRNEFFPFFLFLLSLLSLVYFCLLPLFSPLVVNVI